MVNKSVDWILTIFKHDWHIDICHPCRLILHRAILRPYRFFRIVPARFIRGV